MSPLDIVLHRQGTQQRAIPIDLERDDADDAPEIGGNPDVIGLLGEALEWERVRAEQGLRRCKVLDARRTDLSGLLHVTTLSGGSDRPRALGARRESSSHGPRVAPSDRRWAKSSTSAPGTNGHASPHPIVIRRRAGAATSGVRLCGCACSRSIPTSRIVVTTTGCTRVPGAVPAEIARAFAGSAS